MLRNIRAGWHDPLANALTGPDSAALRRVFQSLQLWLDFPIIGLEGSRAAFASGAVEVAWATELYDDYTMHAPSATEIIVPSQARSYFAIGAFCGAWAGGGAAGRRILSWKRNGVATGWSQMGTSTAVNYMTVPFLGIVNSGDVLAAQCSHDSVSNLAVNDMELWLVFAPMGG